MQRAGAVLQGAHSCTRAVPPPLLQRKELAVPRVHKSRESRVATLLSKSIVTAKKRLASWKENRAVRVLQQLTDCVILLNVCHHTEYYKFWVETTGGGKKRHRRVDGQKRCFVCYSMMNENDARNTSEGMTGSMVASKGSSRVLHNFRALVPLPPWLLTASTARRENKPRIGQS